jgi:DNA polymerase III epsilon subunit family exonuclease
MATQLTNSVFANIVAKQGKTNQIPTAILGGVSGSSFSPNQPFEDLPIVVFDFETTDLDPRKGRIIEIGAIRYVNRREEGRVSELIDPGFPLEAETTRITGITTEMVAGKPSIEKVLPALHDLMRGAVGVAHNAEFDTAFLAHESARLGISCDYHVICTLKMARQLVKSERKNLDALATHFGLSFESRHRSIGDILVTKEILWRMLDDNPKLRQLAHLESYRQPMGAP